MSTLQKSLISGGKYLAVNILISAIGFFRSFLFMRELGMADLGMLSLFQTIIMFLTMLQFGLINGGYRIFAINNLKDQSAVNNLVFSYMGVLFSVFSLIWFLVTIFDLVPNINGWLLLTTICIGFLSLLVTWLTNTLIGKQLLSELNKINLMSGIGALLFLPLIFKYGVLGALISIGIQPVLFICFALLSHNELRPTEINFNKKLAIRVLGYGFIPFFAGIFGLIIIQVERWSIVKILGVTSLGEFYLLFLYNTLFLLIPSSILNIFYPKAIRAYSDNKKSLLFKIFNQHIVTVFIYLIFVTSFTFLFLQSLVDYFLPMHHNGVKYVFAFLPGLWFLVLCDPFSLLLNTFLKLKTILWAGIFSFIIFVFGIWLLRYEDLFSLINIVRIKSIVNIFVFIYYLVGLWSILILIFRNFCINV